jgi:hypothetical protein
MNQLAKAIEKVMRASGSPVLTVKDARTLDGLGAFDHMPSARFILLTAVRSGVAARMVALGENSPETQRLLKRFITHTGFAPEHACPVLEAYACALGWTQKVMPEERRMSLRDLKERDSITGITAEQASNEASEPAADYTPVKAENQETDNNPNEEENAKKAAKEEFCNAPEYTRHLTVAEKIALLNSRLTIEHDNEPVLGVSIMEAEVADISPRGLRLNAVLRRTTPMSSASLNYALFDSDNHLITAGVGAMHTPTAPAFHPLSFEIPSFMLPESYPIPARILLFLS